MACLRLPAALALLPRPAGRTKTPFSKPLVSNPRFTSSLVASTTRFRWEDVMQVSHEDDDRRDLRGYFHKIRVCNRGHESKTEFVPFVIEDQVVGFIHKGFVDHLKEFPGVFTCLFGNGDHRFDDGRVTLHESLSTPVERTRAVAGVIQSLGELIPGIRSEHYPVTSSFGVPSFFSLERAAAPYFGIKAYGVHMNGYVEINGQKFLWIGKRSQMKPTYPGMLDHLVAGGLPHGISCKENLIKECEEEAGIPRSISDSATSVGAISYMDIDGFRYKRDVLFCYDLKLPADFIPNNEDGEVDSFRLIPVDDVANIIRRTEFFKPNCTIVIIDFLFRHGYISPDDCGYLKLLQSLRSGDCS
ncbi:Thiamine diphosphokinase protein [Dioscorea alata]|uniref:Thiamine diphosphokinase protein n=3 Tax=Dioscorea alata TaxID=55571 RepID=A0ACB7TU50_DIOAL|nr:Thiamine diphosphokinase protein [Dioscorea alata]KAH7652060.1 Thiamine diphosphokinase protein [Dioscorea alata]KAH7652061.1 Thiamine diphosphokinase protein [Dioscorea alata]